MTNDGKDYEQFVKKLQQALLDSEDITKQKNIKIDITFGCPDILG